LRLLGLAQRAGQLRLGSGPVLKALQREGRGIVFLARDAGGDIRKQVERALGPSRLDDATFCVEELAARFGRQKLSVVSVHDPSFVSGIAEHLDRS
jgi:hypothetical protein